MNERAEAIVDDIRTLHQHCVPTADIARKLHLPTSTVECVIKTGELPESEPVSQ